MRVSTAAGQFQKVHMEAMENKEAEMGDETARVPARLPQGDNAVITVSHPGGE